MVFSSYVAGKLVSFLGAENLSEQTQVVVEKYFSLNAISRTLLLISSTFYILFILDLVSFTQAGILISIGFIAQAVIDYPTGVIADWLGHKFVLFASYIAHAISFMMLAMHFLIPAESLFIYLVIVYIFEAFALAQESGALQAWFDNNYKTAVGDNDPKRITYRVVYGKTLMVLRFIGGIGIFLGGALSTNITREVVFGIQAVFMVILAFSFLFLLEDLSESEKTSVSMVGYFSMLGKGIKVTFSDPMLRYFIISFVLIVTVGSIWVALLIFPIYFSYTGTDAASGFLRSTMFLAGAAITGFGATLSKRLEVKKWLPRIFWIHALFFYGSYIIITYVFPVEYGKDATLNVLALFFVFLVGSIGNLTSTLAMLLIQRFMVDAVPDENRNSFYSLGPTLGLLLSSVVVIFAGEFIDQTQNIPLTIMIFAMIPMAIAGVMALKSMTYYVSKEIMVPSHPHPLISSDITLTELSHIFIISLPRVFDHEEDIKKAWKILVEMISQHVGSESHEYLDIILEDINEYGSRFTEAIDDQIITADEHDELKNLRKKLIEDAHKIRDEKKLNDEEDKLIHLLVDLLHEMEHRYYQK